MAEADGRKKKQPKSKAKPKTKASPKRSTGRGRGAKGRGQGARGGKGRGRGRGKKALAEAPKTPSPKPKKGRGAKVTPPKTSPKAAPKSKTKKDLPDPDQSSNKAKRTRHSQDEKSFARRARPTKPDILDQWLAIRDSFNEMISKNVASPSSHQDYCMQTCMST